MRKLALTFLACGLGVSSAFAETGFKLRETSFSLSVRDFSWKETIDGKKMVHEKGKLYGIVGEGERRLFGTVDYRLRGEIYGGRVDYKGHAVKPDTGDMYPITTKTTYLVFDAENSFGRKFMFKQGNADISVFPYVGLGVHFWFRESDDAEYIDENGNPQVSSGYLEFYRVIYSPIGLQTRLKYKGVDITLYGQYHYNFFIREWVDIGDGATLKPKRGNAYRIGAKAGYKWFFAEVFYDYMHLKKSNTVTVVDELSGIALDIYQPDSKRKMVGVNVGIRF
ncbi:MAG: hypothetical protein WKI50_00925 [Aquificaceae bacterium]